MSYFGLVTLPWPLAGFAYIGTAIVAGMAAGVAAALLPERKSRFVQWWQRRSEPSPTKRSPS